ncbi:MAG TPA: DUF2500 family protein [Petrotogaceae bacterium]|nr:DUF2500 family protein [Petrotogaceae bacterium]
MFGGSDPFGSFGMFNFIFYGVFFLVIGMFAVILISIVLGWFKNQRSPLIEVQAKVVAKRDHTSIHSRNRSTSSINAYSSFTPVTGSNLKYRMISSDFLLKATMEN